MARVVHLVGSVPLANSEEVFRTTAKTLGTRIKRMPDGETGARGDWVQWLTHLLRAHPQFELPGGSIDYSAGRDVRNYYRVKPGIDPAAVRFGELGYAEHARESYAIFSRLIDEGVIPGTTRFLVAMPTPLAFLQVLVAPDQRALLEKAHFQSVTEEVAALATVVPAEKLAIQWDTVFEVLILEGVRKSQIDDMREGLIERLRRLGAALPAAAELGYHFCYGDMNHKHSLEPPHTGVMVDLANDLTRALPRRVDFIHMPVPRGAISRRSRAWRCCHRPSSISASSITPMHRRHAPAHRGSVARAAEFRHRDGMWLRAPPAGNGAPPARNSRRGGGRLISEKSQCDGG